MSDKGGRVFVDTNILVYAYDKATGGKNRMAQNLVQELWVTRSGCLSVQVLQEFYVTLTRKIKPPIPFEIASQQIADLSTWQVHEPNAKDVLSAIDLSQRYQVSFWDAMIIRSALSLDCAVLWSEDLNAGQVYDKVTVENPFD